ncbi:MAG: twin-arginine translocation signal domain-containing protein [Betaproteobacteria bacterium]|nr:twin-arginine translocation signal domain-containing protein [Betaproteobacteria bacterium]
MKTRRHFLAALAASALTLAAGNALAAPPTVEIVAMPHPPVKMALAPLREWLAEQGGKLKVVEIDVESAQGEKRLAAVGLAGHIPIVILIDGQYRHPRKDGSALALVNFPAIKGAPPGVRGEWTTADVQAVLAERMKKP